MRNGIDISGFSEIVEEVVGNPREAQFRYEAVASWDVSGGSLAKVKPARIGSLRAPRVFEIPIQPTPATQSRGAMSAATPEDLAIVALSGCFLVSVVSGLTVQRCAIETIAMETALDIDADCARPAAAHFNIRSRTDKGSDPTIAVCQTVQSVSPNYRTFSESLAINCILGDDILEFAPLEDDTTDTSSFASSGSLVCNWVYGTQLLAEITSQKEKTRRYPVDQPKQLGGVDWAPNPQEYLLMALSSDVLNGLLKRLSYSELVTGLKITASARVDIRGMCGVDGVPVHLQDVSLEIIPEVRNQQIEQMIRDVLPDVISESRICYLVRQKMRQDALIVS